MISNTELNRLSLKYHTPGYEKWFQDESIYIKNHVSSGDYILDVGCGDGKTIQEIIDLNRNNRIVGIDHNTTTVENTQENFHSRQSVNILLAKADNLPFENNIFDIIICACTFGNFGDRKLRVLGEMKRVLKQSGKIIISVYAENALQDRLQVYESIGIGIQKQHNGTIIFDIDNALGDNISEQFTKEELEILFKEAGLTIIDITTKGIANLCTLTKG